MKYLELWHSSVNLMEKFSSINIGEIRIQYINNMIFSAHNINIKAKETVSNHNAMVSSFKLYIFHYALVCCIHILIYPFFSLSPVHIAWDEEEPWDEAELRIPGSKIFNFLVVFWVW
jgi:hypothetical protein